MKRTPTNAAVATAAKLNAARPGEHDTSSGFDDETCEPFATVHHYPRRVEITDELVEEIVELYIANLEDEPTLL